MDASRSPATVSAGCGPAPDRGTRPDTSSQRLPELTGDLIAHRAQHVERAQRLRLIDPRDGEPDVDDYVFAGLGVRNVGQAGVFANAAVVDQCERERVGVADFRDPAGDSEAH